jgi:penicillin-binding protein 1A
MSSSRRRRAELDQLLGRRNRKRKRTARLRRRRRAGLIAGFIGLVIVVMLVLGLGAGVALSTGCNLNTLRPISLGENSFVYASNGSLLGTIPADRNREPVSLSAMAPLLPKATVAIEDRRFWEHGAVDYIGIARAAWTDITAGKAVQGGSTITQQLVRNLYTGNEKTFQRKLKEACLAIKLAHRWSKDKILDEYLNTVYYGNHAYGVEAASQTYFSKHASQLTLAEAALLAGLPQAPSDYDPLHNPQDALARRNEVLAALLSNGDISQAQYDAALHAPLKLKPGKIYTRIKEPYFFSYVQQELEQTYGASTVAEGGLTVYTTIDPRLQRLADNAIRNVLPYKTDPAAALVSIEPGTGAIRAMTAVVRTKGNQFNLVAQSMRQAGSTFKTFVLASAIEQGVDPDTTYYTSAPFTCSIGPWCQPPWQVHTYENTYSGPESLTRATLQSDNTVYAQLTLDVGPKYVWEMAHRFGVHMAPDHPYGSIGLGALAVSPLDMAAAYAAFPAMGVYAKPMAITKVVLADGRVDKASGWGTPQTKRVVSQGVAWKVNDVLQQNAEYGTGAGSGDGIHPNAGKTGTTENHDDAWFDGYTRQLSTVVWMGYPKGEIPMLDVHGETVQGATFAVPIWHDYMAGALANAPAVDFPAPNAYPVWKSITHGYYGSLGYYAVPTTTYEAPTTYTVPTTVTPAPHGNTPAPSGAGGPH